MPLDCLNGYEARLWLAANVSDRLAPRMIRPTDASIKLTENCQARCVTCDYWKTRWTDHISVEAAIALVRRLGDIGITTLRFTGGEPLLAATSSPSSRESTHPHLAPSDCRQTGCC